MAELALWQYAALSDYIYNRAATDQRINFKTDIPGLGLFNEQEYGSEPNSDLPDTLDKSGNYVYSSRGFGGQILKDEASGNYIVIFRGTDAAAVGPLDIVAANFGLNDPEVIDSGDVQQGRAMSLGTGVRSQARDAIELTKIALVLAGGDVTKVTVTGQSLGGGADIIAHYGNGMDAPCGF